MNEDAPRHPSDYEYRVERVNTHHDMTALLNRVAAEGWEPLHYAIWSSDGSGVHFVMLRRER